MRKPKPQPTKQPPRQPTRPLSPKQLAQVTGGYTDDGVTLA